MRKDLKSLDKKFVNNALAALQAKRLQDKSAEEMKNNEPSQESSSM